MKDNENQKKIEQKTKAKKKKNTITPKQKRFCEEYLVDLNGTQAAIRAGYSPKTADRYAGQLLEKTCVQEFIKQRQKALSKRTHITQEKVIGEISKIAFADFTNYADYRTEKTVVDRDEETGEPIIDYDVVIDVKDSKQVDGSVISEIGRGKDGTFKFKLHDKVKALDMLARHLGMYKDKVEHSGEVGIQVAIDYGSEK